MMDRRAFMERTTTPDILEVDREKLQKEFTDLRGKRGMSQLEVAKLLGVSQATISAFEHEAYDRIRKTTLKGIYRLVQFWKGDAAAAAQATAGSGKTVSLLDRKGPQNLTPEACPSCRKALPKTDEPLPYCPFCKEPLGVVCACEAVYTGAIPNFCQRCGRGLRGDDATGVKYPFLDREEERLRFALLKSLVHWLDREGGLDRIIDSAGLGAPKAEDPSTSA
jgi:DNA-binding XRE family transcriptional regulator